MDKYDDATATLAGEFTDGNPSLDIPRTVLRAAWPNMIQRELISVVQGAGLTLNGAQFDQLFQAIQIIAADAAVPVGTLNFYYGTTAPAGWVEMNGGLVLRADYPRLWTHAQAQSLVVTDAAWSADFGKFSSGNLSTTFRLPDGRGEFLRAWDHGRGVDAGRGLATWAADALKAHHHKWQTQSVGGGYDSGGHEVNQNYTGANNLYNTSDEGGTETRPRGLAAMLVMKA